MTAPDPTTVDLLPGQPAVTLWDGSRAMVLLDTWDGTDVEWSSPVQKATTVARLRAIADALDAAPVYRSTP